MKKLILILTLVVLISCPMIGCSKQGGDEGDKSNVESATKALTSAATNTGTKSATNSPSIPSGGAYWSTYSSMKEPPESFEKLSVTGPFYIDRITIGEESTEQEWVIVYFTKDSTFAYGTNPNDTSKYWVEIIKSAEGKPVKIKLSSNAANDFVINVHLNIIENDLPAYDFYMRSDDGVHSPDGSVIPDPYADPELPIAAHKEMNFEGSHEEGGKFKEALEEAGYTTFDMRYVNKTYTVSFCEKLAGRAKVERDVLKPKGYNINKEKAKKNVGFYSKAGDFSGKIKIDWTFDNIPFTIKIDDVKLVKLEDGEDEISYTMSGTAEVQQKSFTMGDVVFRLKDKQRKPFSEEYGFKVKKNPSPGVSWDYVETWAYVDETYGTPFLLTVAYTTGNSPKDLTGVPVKDLDQIDGTDTMSFMMPAYGGNAIWIFKKENKVYKKAQ